jgi:hypothetical protein
VSEDHLRLKLRRWFGGGRWTLVIDDVARSIVERRPSVIVAPRGAAVLELRALLRAETDSVCVLTEDDDGWQGGASFRVPAIAERRDDLARLLGEARRRAETRLGLSGVGVRDDLPALYAHTWPGHLDEIERVVHMVVALRASGSLRRAAVLVDTTKSTLANRLSAVRIKVRRAA